MLNNRCIIWILAVVLSLSCTASYCDDPKHFSRKVNKEKASESVLVNLLSPNEAVRFQTLEALKNNSMEFTGAEIDQALTQIGEKNVSTLIYMFMEAKDEILYQLGSQGTQTLENTQGSFPNIAYYYGRVRPTDGLNMLIRLYETHPDDRMAICKAMGETGNPRGVDFLLKKTEQAKAIGSRVPMFAGLAVSRLDMEKYRITSLLKTELDREEIILLSKLKTDFSKDELIALYNGNRQEHTYSLEYIFKAPESNFEALQYIINGLIKKRQYDRARELMMSDRIRHSSDDRIQRFRESVMEQINTKRPIRTSRYGLFEVSLMPRA